MPKYKILAFDGGGIRGYFSLCILKHIQQELGKKWVEKAQFLAGTSTGGIIALDFALGSSIDEALAWYESKGPAIFHRSFLEKITNPGRLFHAPYKTKVLKEGLLTKIDPEMSLADLKKKILITSFDLDNEAEKKCDRRWKPKIFHNFKGNNPDDIKVYEAALFTTAAPTYFPSVNGYIDGGVSANNPSMCALAQILDTRNSGKSYNLNDIALVSVGTGNNTRYISKKSIKWGVANWAAKLVEILMDGTDSLADYQCSMMLPEKNYLRIQIDLPDSIQMDSVDRMEDMKQIAFESDVSEYCEWIKANWK